MTITDISVPSAGALRGAVRETTILPDHGGYDAARQAWNLTVDQRPAAVVAARDAEDVAAAIRFARDHGLRIAPQGSGHGAASLGRLGRTMLVRTDRMGSVEVDPAARIARVGAGARWRDVVAATAPHGLAAVAGSPDVGVVGYTLGGGLSFMSRTYGLACNSVVALEIVTGDGVRRRVDAEHDPELFWALRGGGGSFGVVTSLELRLHELTEVYAGSLMFGIERGSEVLHAWARLTRSALPDTFSTVGRFLKFPPIPEVPEPMRGRSFVCVEVFHPGAPGVADELLAGLRSLGPVMDTITVLPTTQLASVHADPEDPMPAAADGMLVGELSEATLDAFIATAGEPGDFPLLSTELRHLGGALARPAPGAGALSHLEAEYAMFSVSLAPVPELAVAAEHQIAQVAAALAPGAARHGYLNFCEQPRRLDAFFAEPELDRMRAVKSEFDPDDLIQANHEL
jgi:FAD/FMN-containing dehydrogenase